MRVPPLSAVIALAAACSGPAKPRGSPEPAARGRVIVLATTELKGQIEPCGCTSDPMGDLARTVRLFDGVRAGGVAVLAIDGGSLLYGEAPVPDAHAAPAALKANLLAATARDRLALAAAGLGPFDLSRGPGQVGLPRQAANLAADSGVPLAPARVVRAGELSVGIFGVVAPALVAPFGLVASDPAAAARIAIASLRANGAAVVLGILHMTAPEAEALAAAVPGIDFGLVGAGAPEPERVAAAPVKVGDTWLFQPANRGQVVSRLELEVRGPGGFVDAIGEARAAAEIAKLDAQLERLRADLAAWRERADAEAAFLAAQEGELAALAARRDALAAAPLALPATGSWFTLSQLPIQKRLACDPATVAAKIEFDAAAGKLNLAAAPAAPPPATGRASFAGDEECGYCHKEAVAFWASTKHARAWHTLVEGGKQLDLDCVYCHATGFGAPGGSTLATLAADDPEVDLRDVRCEVCHGPGSLHIDADGKDAPSTLIATPPESRCVSCHNEQHSDTFDYTAYLRDVTGEGHGAAFRAQLGDGPTGRALRAAALAKASAGLGEGCPK
jgi:hypothetical protein